jgi:hypothetical protein
MNYIIGTDLDNTIINFDEIIYQTALKLGFINSSIKASKINVREAIRQLPLGENKWRQLQSEIYGEGIKEAQLLDGTFNFLAKCRESDLKIYIISHKTISAKQVSPKINFRKSASEFLEENNITNKLIQKNDIFFTDSRTEKVQKIKDLKCTHFIDDLAEVFDHPDFPSEVTKILFDPHYEYSKSKDYYLVHNWGEIYEFFFKSG